MRSRLSRSIAVAVILFASAAHADDEAPAVVEARSEFVRGTDLAKRAQWAEALASFERSSALRPHAVTTYNIGICQRAMGNYTLARETLTHALEENDKSSPHQLADSLVSEDKTFLSELDGLLATANVQLNPANAAVAIDGRPLAVRDAQSGVLVAGVRAPGPGEPAPAASFKVVLNPGAHVFTFSRAGFADSVVNRTVSPGQTVDLRLELDRLPATFHVTSSETSAIVTVNGVDVGAVPVDVSRPAGAYRVIVKKAGFKTYEQQIDAAPGQQLDLVATLPREEKAITSRWWFWTAAGVVVVGVAAGTYALTRSDTTRQEPLDGGGLGWTVKAK
ncbi:MAG TPA: PEGA domain-containing protein [Labilithrix sp.]